MSASVTVVANQNQVQDVSRLLADVPNGMERVLTRALNKVGTAVLAQVVRLVVQEVNLKPSDVRKRNVTLEKANYDTLAAVVRILGSRVPLKYFGASQTQKGVSYAIRRGQRKLVEHAFIATMKSQHKGVFARAYGGDETAERRLGQLRTNIFRMDAEADIAGGHGGRIISKRGLTLLRKGRPEKVFKQFSDLRSISAGQRVGRLPIVEQYGPSVPEVATGIEELSQQMFERQAGEALQREIDVQTALVFQRQGRPA